MLELEPNLESSLEPELELELDLEFGQKREQLLLVVDAVAVGEEKVPDSLSYSFFYSLS